MDVTPSAALPEAVPHPLAQPHPLARPDAPKRVRIAGDLSDVRFPALCTRCAAPPAGHLVLTKMFRRAHSDSPTRYVFARTHVPFCRDCLAAHERERQPPDPRVLRTLRNQWLVRCLPYVLPVVIILYLLGQFARPMFAGVTSGDMAEALIFGAVVAFFGLMLAMFVRLILVARRDLIAGYTGDPNDQYVEIVRGPFGITCVIPGPPTSTLSAVDFTDEESELFEPDKRTFTFANPLVREQFATLNAELVWRRNSPRARRARLARRVVLAVLATIGAAFLVAEYLGYY